MKTQTPHTVCLKDYAPASHTVERVHLDIDWQSEGDGHVAFVTSEIVFAQNPAHSGETGCLTLAGEELETLWVKLDDQPIQPEITPTELRLTHLPERFSLSARVKIRPDDNHRLMGLYRSKDGYFTQCEPEGFRRITWFLDRPDVMSVYTVKLHADAAAFPVLLSNGNLLDSGDEADGRHWALWQDPFKKPSYLFAMVAAKLDVLRDEYVTAQGKPVQLAVYVEPGKLDQCPHAMAALKKAMRWDEQRFGLSCDLDQYMIAAVGDFNMGAMENKGLNIFNTKYVLARADTATDTDFENIDRVVAHEYFHNWTGDRVTCRDWFQLSLKEGLTVFREQEFGADTHHAATARLREVRGLRAAQFPEDAGPMAHPVRPVSYMEINNFYTATVYEKGAEVVRMIQTLIGREKFREGMDEYFRRHDGQAVTCEDFVAAMAAASGFDFARFMAWYRQPGTPHIQFERHYDAKARRFALRLAQSNPKAQDMLGKEATPYLIPVRVALFDPAGQLLPGTEKLLVLDAPAAEFVFEDIDTCPMPSILRDFSAPVVLEGDYSDAELQLLLAHDTDPFNAWEAGQRLASRLILQAAQGAPLRSAPFIDAARQLLGDFDRQDPAFIAECLLLPGESTLAESLLVVDPDALHAARQGLRLALAQALEPELAACHRAMAVSGPYRFDPVDAGKRALGNLCLGYLLELDDPAYRQQALAQCHLADNMTDAYAALTMLANDKTDAPEREAALTGFYARWQNEALVVDKWLAAQAMSRRTDAQAQVERLTRHPAFDARNPNKIYALIRAFAANFPRFHAADGKGYAFIADWILAVDPDNPMVAARLARAFDR
ncbi:MAG: aminopeptidase N, partial [Zoogloeaceae bacterium]|nr:aminopeptidase N [Zoogloeaceae bacterium]